MTKRRTDKEEPPGSNQTSGAQLVAIVAAFACLLLGINWIFSGAEKPLEEDLAPPSPDSAQPHSMTDTNLLPRLGLNSESANAPRSVIPLHITNIWDENIKAEYWFDGVPDWLREASLDTGDKSNIRPSDYAGPESCKECHPGNYDNWRGHAHRRMNEIASPETVLGDFSGSASIQFKGGKGTFYTDNGNFRMATEKEGVRRVYQIERTIGSRFFQYYAGKLIEVAPAEQLFESPAHPYTRGLMNSFPDLHGEGDDLRGVPGNPPDLRSPPSGCRFHPRCTEAKAECSAKEPQLVEIGVARRAACHLIGDPGDAYREAREASPTRASNQEGAPA